MPNRSERTALLAGLGAIAALIVAPAKAAGPTVVELFTSQSCYSCPPAEAFLGELGRRPNLIALEFHVDYWNELVYGSAGKWRDRFSQPAFTERQRRYNQAIRGKAGVYTPQMVVGGQREAVGSDRAKIDAAIADVAKDGAGPEVRIALGERSAIVELAGGKESAKVWLVRYIVSETTRVAGGENKDKTLKNHNIVTEIREIGMWRGEPIRFNVSGFVLGPNEGCAVIVQDENLGPVLGAGACGNQGS